MMALPTSLEPRLIPPPPCRPVADPGISSFSGCAGLPEESAWRHPPGLEKATAAGASILASRWVDERNSYRRESAQSPAGRHVISLAMKTTQVRLSRGSVPVFDGMMPAGMLQVTRPCHDVSAEFRSPCDFIHLYVKDAYFEQHRENTEGMRADIVYIQNDFLVRDPLVEQLGRTLIEAADSGDMSYADIVGQTIAMRALRLRQRPPSARISALPHWRLKRVFAYIEANLDQTVTLAELAATCGLSRMHFAAQFRVATGCRPHEYLLRRRIERAKLQLTGGDMPLTEVALSVGFQAQSHFTTVFKQLTGETPGSWRRNRAGQP
jgi:AraC family transcriptional regulator